MDYSLKDLWDYWKLGSDEIEPTDEKISHLEKEDRSDEDKLPKSSRSKTGLTYYETPLDLAEKKSTMLVKYLQSGNLEVLES
ncbi:hypothetical protein Tco_0123627 [Tanacetum coccineum]